MHSLRVLTVEFLIGKQLINYSAKV
jgi:hypothetical protein